MLRLTVFKQGSVHRPINVFTELRKWWIMVYSEEIKVKVFRGTLSQLEASVNSWVSKNQVLVKDIKHDCFNGVIIWIVLYQEWVAVIGL